MVNEMPPTVNSTSASRQANAHSAASALGGLDAIQGLQSSEQSQLLDVIDKVRECVDADMKIPQIVVCGDQSSGKSSVLEAIAQIRFPVGNQAVTKFPTEVILRHAPEASIKVRLNPSHDRPQPEQDRIRRFRPTTQIMDGAAFTHVVQEAKAHLEATDPGRKFWDDWLSAEVSGPEQPHLTLVDLPGLIHFSGQGGDVEDIVKIRNATCRYLKNERAIILAVVNSMNDPANQQVLNLVEKTGDARQRTMGILTKPDEIDEGSEKEKAVLGLARNDGIHLGLGWHVLRNIAHDDKKSDQKRRDEVEHRFFSAGAWAALDKGSVGIESLRARLSRSLLECIKKGLPKLVEDIQAKVKTCSKELSGLGESRETLSQQREYLSKILGHLQRIAQAALNGHYRETEHSAFFNGAKQTRLRDAINVLNDGFAVDLRTNGKKFVVYDKDCETDRRFPEVPSDELPIFDQPCVPNGLENQPRNIRLKRYCKALARHMATQRGKSLRTHPSEVVPEIFRQQSVFWESITRKHVEMCYATASGFMSAAVIYVAGRHTGDKIMQYHMNEAFDKKRDALDEKVIELLWPFQESHPITYNPAFERKISRNHEDRSRFEWIGEADSSNALYSALEAIHQATAYYAIAVDNLVDNVATLAVEKALLHDMPNLMVPAIVHVMSDEEMARIATEPEESKSRRKRLTAQLEALQSALRTCRRHAQHVPTRNTPERNPIVEIYDENPRGEKYDDKLLNADNSGRDHGRRETAHSKLSTQRPQRETKTPSRTSGATARKDASRAPSFGAQNSSLGPSQTPGYTSHLFNFGNTDVHDQSSKGADTASGSGFFGSGFFGSGQFTGTGGDPSRASSRSPASGNLFARPADVDASSNGHAAGSFGSSLFGGERTNKQNGSTTLSFGPGQKGLPSLWDKKPNESGGWPCFDLCDEGITWNGPMHPESLVRKLEFQKSSLEFNTVVDDGIAIRSEHS